MIFPLPESGEKVSFSTLKVRESQGITFLETRMNPVESQISSNLQILQFDRVHKFAPRENSFVFIWLFSQSSISLMEISLECLSTTSGKHTQSYPLAPPYSRAGVR